MHTRQYFIIFNTRKNTGMPRPPFPFSCSAKQNVQRKQIHCFAWPDGRLANYARTFNYKP